MRARQWWIIGCTLVSVVALAFGWFFGAAPLLGAARSADETRAGVEAQNAGYDQQLTVLKAQFAGIDALAAQLAELRTELPAGTAFPAYDAELISAAQQHGVTISSISVSDAVPYAPVVVDDAAAPAETPADGSAPAEPEATAAPTETAPVAVAAGVPFSSPLVTTDNFVAIPIAITVVGGYPNVLDFLEGVQMGPRLTTVSAFNTAGAAGPAAVVSADGDPVAAPAAGEAAVTGTISVYVYVLRDATTVG